MNYKILTIDQGTTSSRSITYDINGGTIESSQYEYPLIYPEDGWVEIDPQVLMDSVIKSLNDIDKDDIELISITNQRETTIVWEKQSGNPVYNAIVWQDRRTSQYCESIRSDDLENTLTNENYFAGYLTTIRGLYQFDKNSFIRVVQEYNDFNDNGYTQLLFQWQPNSATIFYFGGTFNQEDIEGTWEIESSQIYMKFQYLFNFD